MQRLIRDDVYIFTNTRVNKGKPSYTVLLAESYRENGQVKRRLIANLSKVPKDLLEELKLLLKGGTVRKIEDFEYTQGKSIGAIYVLNEIFNRTGISKSIGNDYNGKLALFQIAGRIITHGSRLHLANEWIKHQAIEDVFGFDSISEDELYANIVWLSDNQDKIEDKLFKKRNLKGTVKTIYLYDVSSSYLEGECNELGEYGYNRDGKKGKKQIVYGLLCDDEGYPITIEAFKGNTTDSTTVINQLIKLKDRFGLETVVFVGDKGMIKKNQIEKINDLNWYYLTSITKPQITKLIGNNVLQLSMFDENIHEIEYEGNRYILRRNPDRAMEIERSRRERTNYIIRKINQKNNYLKEHKRASPETALKNMTGEIKRRRIEGIITIQLQERELIYTINESGYKDLAILDGCYVIKSNAPENTASGQQLHDRYKDLAMVEQAFRTMKTGFEEIRPVYLRKEKRTRGHIFVCMLAYMAIRYIWKTCKDLGETQKNLIESLNNIQYIQYNYSNKNCIKVLPSKLSDTQTMILNKLDIKLPLRL